jgi:hypothetical protein
MRHAFGEFAHAKGFHGLSRVGWAGLRFTSMHSYEIDSFTG